ncbi:MAG: aldehyde ferredoxin oxidoreductase family protein [Crenarchaeota archaeon]|nr:aldehyde ferredoxin oxidoreductase family protein [Thermoproteota archaeon]
MCPGGYVGRIARVNLWKGKVYYETLPENVLRMWVGGRGLGVYLMLKEVDPKVDPFSPSNKAIIATGPLTGLTGAPSSGRWTSITKSPLTGTVHDSHSGGKFGPVLKFAGFDAIIIEDVSERPVWLWVHDGKIEIREASRLWGLDVHSTTNLLKEEISSEIGKDEAEKASIACIGPAGERLVKFASIMNDYNRAAGRGGHGAVWGSKKLKAVVAYGKERPKIANEEKFREASRRAMEKLRTNSVTGQALPKLGTAVLVKIINDAGILPTRNFKTGVFPEADKISGEVLAEKYLVPEKQRKEICWGCPIGCARYTQVREGRFTGEGGGPEYETIWAFGPQCGVSDFPSIMKANYLCNELGLDTITMGHVVGTFMELVERGRIPKELLRGLKVEWGNPEVIVELVWRTAYRSGIGDHLAEGAKRLAETFQDPDVAMVVRGQELPAYDPRGVQGHGLGYATSNRGGCHLRAYMISPEVLGVPRPVDRFDTKGKPEIVKHFQDVFAVVDSLVLCKFTTFALWVEDYVPLLAGATGWDITEDEFCKIGERIYNAERVFNVLSFGDGRQYDTLPRRLLEEPMPEGPSKGHVVRLGEMLDEYYRLRGWKDGRPTRAKLEELGLKWLADRLEEEGLLPE